MKKQQKILIIDDEKDLCELLKLFLKSENFKIDCAFSLQEGKRKWRNLSSPIVLLDQNLPDGTGLSLIAREPGLLLKSKVIMITADAEPATKILAMSAGIEHFIQKPFSLKVIRDLVDEIISVYDGIYV